MLDCPRMHIDPEMQRNRFHRQNAPAAPERRALLNVKRTIGEINEKLNQRPAAAAAAVAVAFSRDRCRSSCGLESDIPSNLIIKDPAHGCAKKVQTIDVI